MARTMARARFSSPSVGDDGGKLAVGQLVDEIARRWAIAAHAHVEGTVLDEGEAALGLVDLHGGHTEIERNAVYRCDAFTFGDLAHLGIAAEHEF